MSVNETKSDAFLRFDRDGVRKNVDIHCLSGLNQFKRIIRSYAFFHLFFFGLLLAEIFAFFIFLTPLFQMALVALSVAIILVTGFAYLMFLFYFQTKKPEQFLELRNYFMHLCKRELPESLLSSEYHLLLASAAYRFASKLGGQDSLIQFKSNALSLNHLMSKFINLCHKRDIQRMKEVLLIVSINEHIQLIKDVPTDLEAHASLANVYVTLSRLYHNQEKSKFRGAAKKAIQEFKIVDYYSPKDPWVHAQLASCYHDIEMFDEEIKEYETILHLCPEDTHILFRLGTLYFRQGENAKGLKIYEQLQSMQCSRADELLEFYDSNLEREYRNNM